MLKKLILKNFILIDETTVEFKKGFNVISGETGSGKTILLQALSLLFGQRAERSHIRSGHDTSTLFCLIDIGNNQEVYKLLKDSGVEIEQEEDLLIQREITTKGKSRSFINNQQVSLTLLKQIAPSILEIISASSQLELKDEQVQLEYLDLFAKTDPDLRLYQEAFHEEKAIEKELVEINRSYKESAQLLEYWKRSIDEIDQADLENNQEDELFERFKKLSNSKDLILDAKQCLDLVEEQDHSILSLLTRLLQQITKIVRFDSSFESPRKEVETARQSLSEVSFFLAQYIDSLDLDPKSLSELEDKLSTINHLKKKFGGDVENVLKTRDDFEKKVYHFEHFEQVIEEKKKLLRTASEKRKALAESLSKKRTLTAKVFSKKIEEELHEMQMSSAQFEIHISKISPNLFGEDAIEYFMSANTGETMQPLKMCASGGEISRVLLALKLILASHQTEKILLFDEIDANIGGETASLIAKKLSLLGKQRQLFCITHFPQVAKEASYHLKIQKSQDLGRTKTTIEPIEGEKIMKELSRMMGGLKAPSK